MREQQAVAVGIRVDKSPGGVGQRAEVGGRVARRHRAIQRRSEVRGDLIADRADQGGAVGHVLVERGATDAHALRDRTHDDSIETAFLEEGAGGFDDGFA